MSRRNQFAVIIGLNTITLDPTHDYFPIEFCFLTMHFKISNDILNSEKNLWLINVLKRDSFSAKQTSHLTQWCIPLRVILQHFVRMSIERGKTRATIHMITI